MNNLFDTGRRQLLAGLASLAATPALAAIPTPRQSEGPFYPPANLVGGSDADLLKSGFKGSEMTVFGKLVLPDGSPVAGRRLDLWQADADGNYHHRRAGGNPDPAFDGFGQVVTGPDGSYRFRTVMPGEYPGRTRHLHFKVWSGVVDTLTTQMYFPDEPGNARDGLFDYLSPEGQSAATATRLLTATEGPPAFQFDITLA